MRHLHQVIKPISISRRVCPNLAFRWGRQTPLKRCHTLILRWMCQLCRTLLQGLFRRSVRIRRSEHNLLPAVNLLREHSHLAEHNHLAEHSHRQELNLPAERSSPPCCSLGCRPSLAAHIHRRLPSKLLPRLRPRHHLRLLHRSAASTRALRRKIGTSFQDHWLPAANCRSSTLIQDRITSPRSPVLPAQVPMDISKFTPTASGFTTPTTPRRPSRG